MAEKKWLEPASVTVPPELARAVGGPPLVAELLVRRGMVEQGPALAYLDPDRYAPASPHELPDMGPAVQRLLAGLEAGQRIWVWGDFDADGQTATAILMEALGRAGAKVDYYLPDREESHGVNVEGLATLLGQGADLVLTCDTGVTAHDEARYLGENGVDLIITDHHDLPETLPEAVAVINPKRLSPSHPLRELTGAGVAYKLAEALNQALGVPERTEGLLDLTAIGMVGDVAVLVDDVRYLVQRGLAALRETRRTGLVALMEVARLNPAGLDEGHIGYAIAPRLNALGRLDDARRAVELLLTSDPMEAQIIAHAVEGLNDRRRLLVSQITDAAEEQLQRDPDLLRQPALVLAHPGWPGGIIGIVAGRLADRYAKPAVLISVGADGQARASARSVPGCDIHAAIEAQSDLLLRYGGHPMAAGFAIRAEDIPQFRQRLIQTVAEMMAAAPYVPELQIDAYVRLGDVDLALAEALARLGPFGNGNPPITLAARHLALASHAVIGRTEEHRRMVVEDPGGESRTVLQWHAAHEPLPEGRFDLAFSLGISDYQGQTSAQLTWIEARPVALPEEARPAIPTTVQVVDYRRVSNPLGVLRGILNKEEGCQVWAEGANRPEGARTRNELGPAEALVIWSIPPGPSELAAALAATRPARAYLLAQDPGLDAPKAFASRLLGVIKAAINQRGGSATVAELAAAMAHRQVTARVGVQWLAAKGLIRAQPLDGGYRFEPGDGNASEGASEVAALLRALLEETAVYRRVYLRSEPDALVAGGDSK